MQQQFILPKSQFQLGASHACTALALDTCAHFLRQERIPNSHELVPVLALGATWWNLHVPQNQFTYTQQLLPLKWSSQLQSLCELSGPCSLDSVDDSSLEARERGTLSLLTALQEMEVLAEKQPCCVAAVITRDSASYALLLKPRPLQSWGFLDTHGQQAGSQQGSLLLHFHDMSAASVACRLVSALGGEQDAQRSSSGDYVVPRPYSATVFKAAGSKAPAPKKGILEALQTRRFRRGGYALLSQPAPPGHGDGRH